MYGTGEVGHYLWHRTHSSHSLSLWWTLSRFSLSLFCLDWAFWFSSLAFVSFALPFKSVPFRWVWKKAKSCCLFKRKRFYTNTVKIYAKRMQKSKIKPILLAWSVFPLSVLRAEAHTHFTYISYISLFSHSLSLLVSFACFLYSVCVPLSIHQFAREPVIGNQVSIFIFATTGMKNAAWLKMSIGSVGKS